MIGWIYRYKCEWFNLDIKLQTKENLRRRAMGLNELRNNMLPMLIEQQREVEVNNNKNLVSYSVVYICYFFVKFLHINFYTS